MQQTFTHQHFVSANEGNAQGELGLQHLVGAIIEVATAHANSLEIGNPNMQDICGGWVLSRLTIDMAQYPRVNETYTLTTWIQDFNRRFSVRNFRIDNAKGETLGYAQSIWMIIHTQTHTPLPLTHLNLDPAIISGEKIPIESAGRHHAIVPPGTPDAPAGAITADTEPRKYRFKYCDVDYYRHVNTVRYIVLLLNQYTLDDMDANMLRRIDLTFMREGEYGMTTDIMTRRDPDEPLATAFALCPEGRWNEPILYSKITLQRR